MKRLSHKVNDWLSKPRAVSFFFWLELVIEYSASSLIWFTLLMVLISQMIKFSLIIIQYL